MSLYIQITNYNVVLETREDLYYLATKLEKNIKTKVSSSTNLVENKSKASSRGKEKKKESAIQAPNPPPLATTSRSKANVTYYTYRKKGYYTNKYYLGSKGSNPNKDPIALKLQGKVQAQLLVL